MRVMGVKVPCSLNPGTCLLSLRAHLKLKDWLRCPPPTPDLVKPETMLCP